MNNLKEISDKFNLNIRTYQEIKNIKVIDTDQGKYVVKSKTKANDDLYQYLDNKNFPYILEHENRTNYELFPYVEEVTLPKAEKAIELVYILALLHNKTTFYQEVALDKVKQIYETLTDEIEYLNYYYHDLQDMIEQKVYMAPEEYLLIRNISLVYSACNFAKESLNRWYDYKKNQKRERVVLLHGNPKLDHLLIGQQSKLISWDHYKRDIAIYDFINFYKSDYLDLEMATLFEMYQSKFSYTKDELLLFLTILAIPKKLTFSKNHYNNCYEVFKFVKYLEKTRDFVLKENEKAEKTNY